THQLLGRKLLVDSNRGLVKLQAPKTWDRSFEVDYTPTQDSFSSAIKKILMGIH
ncbi:hypothetical protein AAVH_32682, partial [Aphelenchoides avenae]